MTFLRARTEEQREIRRRAILDTAAAMLAEMPVAEVSLNELSRRVGKRSSLTRLAAMSELVRRHLPEVGDGAELFCLMTLVSAGALSSYVPPPASLLAAYADEPDLGVFHLELQDALRVAFTSSLLGVLPRSGT